jgi:hypothetical protein
MLAVEFEDNGLGGTTVVDRDRERRAGGIVCLFREPDSKLGLWELRIKTDQLNVISSQF